MAITTNADKVRVLIGDLDSADYLLTVDEVAYLLAEQGDDIHLAAVACCSAIMAKYARYVDVQFGRSSEKQSQLYAHYKELRTELKGLVVRGEQGSLYAGGIIAGEAESDAGDTDLVQPGFTVGMHDNED